MDLHKVIELLMNSITVRYEVVQMVLTTSLNVRSWVVGMRRHPRQCCDASKVSEANSFPLTAMSSRCSQTATQRALA